MNRLIFDIETDGLYNDASVIHCVAIHDLDTGQTLEFNDQGNREPISTAISHLDGAEWIIGHNVVGYDVPVIRKIYPWFSGKGKTLDTLLLSQLTYPNLMGHDLALKPRGMPTKLYGKHSLEAWGYRLGIQKDDFGKTTDWKHWSQEMQDYNVQDTFVTLSLWQRFQKIYPGLP